MATPQPILPDGAGCTSCWQDQANWYCYGPVGCACAVCEQERVHSEWAGACPLDAARRELAALDDLAQDAVDHGDLALAAEILLQQVALDEQLERLETPLRPR